MSFRISRSRLAELLALVGTSRVAVVGDAMLDIYLSGDAERISPEAPVPVIRVRQRRQASGGATNVGENIVALGARCMLVAAVGNDLAGAEIRTRLSTIGISGSSVVTVERQTTKKTRVVARSQQLLRFDEEDDAALDASELDLVLEQIDHVIPLVDAVILEDYNKGVLEPCVIERTIALATERRIPIIVDPKYRNFFSFTGSTIFKPNRSELHKALGAAFNVENAYSLPEALKRVGSEHLLLTRGDEGMTLVSRDGSVVHMPTVAREVYDVTGAGDTVSAYLGAFLAAGASVLEAAWIANVAAGLEVGKRGAATVSALELLTFVDEHLLCA